MAVEIQGKAGLLGVTAVTGDNNLLDPALGSQGQAFVSDWTPRYSELARRNVLYCGANQATQAITSLNATATGLILYNPFGSGVNLWLVDCLLSPGVNNGAVIPAVGYAANINPIAAAPTGLTSLTIQSALMGGAIVAKGKLFSAATLPAAPVLVRQLAQIQNFNVAPAAGTAQAFIKDEIAGALGISPGCAISLTATAAFSALASFTWAEIPL